MDMDKETKQKIFQIEAHLEALVALKVIENKSVQDRSTFYPKANEILNSLYVNYIQNFGGDEA